MRLSRSSESFLPLPSYSGSASSDTRARRAERAPAPRAFSPAMRHPECTSLPARTTSTTRSCRVVSAGRSPCTDSRPAGCSRRSPCSPNFRRRATATTKRSKAMLTTTFGQVPWDDTHHTEMSLTDGVQDGRWLFINANNTPRIARIDLKRFETVEILQIPNAAGGHASPFATPDTKYVVSATRFSVPIPQADVPIDELQEELQGNADVRHGESAGQDGRRVPDHDARLRLRSRPFGKGSVRRMVLLHDVQLRAGEHEARGERVAGGQGLHRGRQLQEGRAVHCGREGEKVWRVVRAQLRRSEDAASRRARRRPA